jgi:hypothetical protein
MQSTKEVKRQRRNEIGQRLLNIAAIISLMFMALYVIHISVSVLDLSDLPEWLALEKGLI